MKAKVCAWLNQKAPALRHRLDGWGERSPPGLLIITIRRPEDHLPALFRLSGSEGHFLLYTRRNAAARVAQDHLRVLWKESSTLAKKEAYSLVLPGTWGITLRGKLLGLRAHRKHLRTARARLGGVGTKTEGAHLKEFTIKGFPSAMLEDMVISSLLEWGWDVELVNTWVRQQGRTVVVIAHRLGRPVLGTTF